MYRPREEYELESRQGSGRSGRLYPDIQSETDDELGRESLKWKEVFVRVSDFPKQNFPHNYVLAPLFLDSKLYLFLSFSFFAFSKNQLFCSFILFY